MISLGYIPVQLTVSVTRDTDFVATLTADPTWPDGTDLELQFLTSDWEVTHTWATTVASGDATWVVPAATVATLIDSVSRNTRLVEVGVGTSQVWAQGSVRVN